MNMIRTSLAFLALASFTTAFTGEPGTLPAQRTPTCQVAQCTMGMAKTAHEAPAPAATLGSWYLPTWEEASAAADGTAACDEAGSRMAPAKQEGPAAARTIPSSWYLPTWEEAANATTWDMACCGTPCPMEQDGHAKHAPAGNPIDSWYLPS
jgi:hypothetical protein